MLAVLSAVLLAATPRLSIPASAPAFEHRGGGWDHDAPGPWGDPAPQRGSGPIVPFYAVLGGGGAFLVGDLTPGVSAGEVYDPQANLYLEGGLRLSPELAVGVYADVGAGEPAREVRSERACADAVNGCTATTGRVGVLLRHTFQPYAYSTPWIAVGTGLEWGSVHVNDRSSSQRYFDYTGWEALRLMGGVDLRSTPLLGVGVYGGVAWGRYARYEDSAGVVDLDRGPFHGTVEAGVRLTLFP